jgi:hypothetical protein
VHALVPQARLGDKNLFIESGYAASSLAALLHDRIHNSSDHRHNSQAAASEKALDVARLVLVVLAYTEVRFANY